MRIQAVRWLVLALTAVVSLGLSQAQTCSKTTTGTLWAGQTQDVGTLTVENKLENGQHFLYVKYTFDDGVTVSELHLWVGKSLGDMPQTKPPKGSQYGNPIPQYGNPIPGKFPYDMTDATQQNGSYVFKIPLADIFGQDVEPCGEKVYVVAHAAIYVNGKDETAFAGSGSPCYINPPGRWWCYVAHVICCDDTTPPQPGCWENETAWAEGHPYNEDKGGNWAMYVYYTGETKTVTVDLLAGQTMDAGDVTLEPDPDNGLVMKITVTINSLDWRFAPVTNNLKVQGYSSPPSGNPAPGQFAHKTTCSSTSKTCTITVQSNSYSYYPYYGIHVDVEKAIPCP
jgi:hypothetical protein